MKYLLAIFMLIILVAGCAPVTTTPPPSATPPATTPPVAPSTPPVTTPSAPAPVTPPPPVKVMSFASATYTDDVLGFTWQYPKNWEKAESYGNAVIKMAAPPVTPRSDSAGVFAVAETADLNQAIKDYIKASGSPITSVDIAPAKAITLADGKTPASESIANLKNIMGIDVYYYAIGFNKGGKTIVAWGYTLMGENNKALLREIVQTLAVK